MARRRALLAVLAVWLPSLALAHTRLEVSAPADGARVASPTAIVLEFSEPVHVTAVALEAEAGAGQPIGEIPAGPAESFAIPVNSVLAPGAYVFRWRAVSADTHIVSGELSFVVEE